MLRDPSFNFQKKKRAGWGYEEKILKVGGFNKKEKSDFVFFLFWTLRIGYNSLKLGIFLDILLKKIPR